MDQVTDIPRPGDESFGSLGKSGNIKSVVSSRLDLTDLEGWKAESGDRRNELSIKNLQYFDEHAGPKYFAEMRCLTSISREVSQVLPRPDSSPLFKREPLRRPQSIRLQLLLRR